MRRFEDSGRLEQPLNISINLFNIRAVFLLRAFDILQFPRQVLVSSEVFSQADECPDDQDVQSNRALARQDGRKHRYSMLGGGIRPVARSTMTST
jgi:hypothetical protein